MRKRQRNASTISKMWYPRIRHHRTKHWVHKKIVLYRLHRDQVEFIPLKMMRKGHRSGVPGELCNTSIRIRRILNAVAADIATLRNDHCFCPLVKLAVHAGTS